MAFVDLSQFIKPLLDIQVRDQKLYLYRLTTSSTSPVEKLDASRPVDWFKLLLSNVGSFVQVDKVTVEPDKLPDSWFQELARVDLDRIAEALAQSSFLRWISTKATPLARTAQESAIDYLARAVPMQISESRNETRKLFESMANQSNSLLKNLSTAASGLDRAVRGFDVDQNRDLRNEASRILSNNLGSQIEHSSRIREERVREISASERTAEMSAKSASALSELIVTAGIFMQRFDDRSASADRDMRSQLRIAIGGIVISGILAAIALGFSIAAYFQDSKNNRSNDNWQNDTTKLLRDSAELAAKQLDVTSKLTAPTQSHNQIPQQTEQSRRKP
jgi:hypothetical protein